MDFLGLWPLSFKDLISLLKGPTPYFPVIICWADYETLFITNF